MTGARPGGIVVIVAVQDASRAKSRLGADLDPGTRRSLVIAMLDDLLGAVREAHAGRLLVVSADPVYDVVAFDHGAEVIRDGGAGINAAMRQGLEAVERDADAALLLPGDLPQARPEDLRTVLAALDDAGVVLVASEDGGTTALGLRPPGALRPAFGEGSAQRHRVGARRRRIAMRELAPPSLTTDVDTLDDLGYVWNRVGEATTALLEHLPVAPRGRP